MTKKFLLKSLLLLCALVAGSGSVWAEEETIATATFDGKNGTYTEGWTTTGTGKSRSDCIIIGSGENITSPTFNLSGYSEVTITFTGRRYGSLSGSKATVDASISGTSMGTIDITSSSVGNVSGSIRFTPTSAMTAANIVFSCTNATSAGSTHGAGIGSITIKGTPMGAPLSSITLSGEYPTVFFTGDSFSSGDVVVTATYEDNSTKEVTSKSSFSGYNMETAGTQEVTVSYTEGEVTATAKYNITVNERPKFTVTLSDDGSVLAEATAGAGVVLPSRDNAGEYEFKGWSPTENSIETTTAPTIIAAGAYAPNSNITLYPVYARTEGELTSHSVNIGDYATANNWETEGGTGQYFEIKMDDYLTVSVTPQSGNQGKVYTNNEVVNWRIYSGATLKFTSASDNIVEITINTQDSGFGLKYGDQGLTRGKAFEVTPSKEISLSGSATARITEMIVITGEVEVYYTSNPVTTLAVSVGAKGFATLVSDYALDFTGKSIKAYTINSADGSKLTLTQKNKVAKNEPVLLYSETASDSQEIPVIAESEATVDGTNKLVAGTGDALTWSESEKYYILYTGGEAPGFYRANASPVAVGKAYLDLTSVGASARSFSLNFDDEATGISALLKAEERADNKVYNLNGQRVAQPQKGLYIINGKKVMVK